MGIREFRNRNTPDKVEGVIVTTTLGTMQEFRRAYFSFKDYSPEEAWELAQAVYDKWRGYAEMRKKEQMLDVSQPHADPTWIASGFRAMIGREGKRVNGERKYHHFPTFWINVVIPGKTGRHRNFRVSEPTGNGIERRFHQAVKFYCELRNLDIEDQALLLTRQPSPEHFVKEAIRMGQEDVAIDINSIRRRVGIPEL